jgi:hypothetical protein
MSLLREAAADFTSGKRELTTSFLLADTIEVDELDVNSLVVDALLAQNLITVKNSADPTHSITLDPTVPSITLTDGVNTNVITSIGGGGGGSDADRLLLSDATASALTYYPSFATALTNYQPHFAASNLSFVPSTSTLTCANFAGNATSASTVANTGGVVTNATFFPSFFAANSTSNQGTQTSASLTFNPSTATLTCTNFAGAATTATSASAVSNTGAVSTNATFYPAFMAANTTSNQATNTATGLTFNPSTSVVTVSGTAAAGSTRPQLVVTNSSTAAGSDTGTVVEVYRSNVANPGDETGRFQFAAKDATSTKRVSGAIRSVPAATNPVYNNMVFSVATANTLTDFLTVSGANDTVIFHKNANFQGGSSIVNVDSITTTTPCRYAPQLLRGFKEFNVNLSFPGPVTDHTIRLYSQGIDPGLRVQTFPGSPDYKVYDSVEFYSNVTSSTNVYFATDSGVWYYDGVNRTELLNLNGRALCMLLIDGKILVGGEFTLDNNTLLQYEHLLLIDANHTISALFYDNYPGNQGVDGFSVNALVTDGSGWFYFGGKFTKTNGGALSLHNFGIGLVTSPGVYQAYAIDDNSGGGANGIDGTVHSIALDPVAGKTQLILVGDFIGTQCSPGGSLITTSDQYATVWYNLGDQNSNPSPGSLTGFPFQYVGSGPTSFNDVLYVVATRATDVYFGGRAANIDGTGANYLVYCDANAYATLFDGNPSSLYSTPVTALSYKALAYGTYWWVGTQAGEFYLNDQALITFTGGVANRVVWTPAYGVFLIESDFPTTYSYNPSLVTTVNFTESQSLIVYPNLTYTGGVTLLNKGAYADMQYINGTDYLLVGSQGATFF